MRCRIVKRWGPPEEAEREEGRLPSVVRVTNPPAVVSTSVHGLLTALLVVALFFKVLASTRSIETAATADIAIVVRRPGWELIPLNARECWVLSENGSRQEWLWGLHAPSLRERLEASLPGHHATKVLSWHWCEHAIAIVQLLVLAIPFTLLARLLFE